MQYPQWKKQDDLYMAAPAAQRSGSPSCSCVQATKPHTLVCEHQGAVAEVCHATRNSKLLLCADSVLLHSIPHSLVLLGVGSRQQVHLLLSG